MATQNTLLQLVMHVKYGANGWSEKYFMPQTTFASASLIAGRITLWRARSLADGCQVVWSRMSFVDTPRNTVACLTAPLGPLSTATSVQAGVIEDPYTSLHYRFETADGLWANRLIRGIADEVVEAMELQPNASTWLPFGSADALPDYNDPGVLRSQLLLGYLEYARRNTIHAKKLPGPVVAYETTEWNKIVFRKIGNRQTGAAFGTTRGRARKRVVAA